MIRTPMMLLLSGDDAANEAAINASLDDIANQGFDAICLEFRDSNYNEFDEIGRGAMRTVANGARERGMKFCKIMPHCSKEICERYPFLRRKILKEVSVEVVNGVFSMVVPKMETHSAEKIQAAFHVVRDENGRIITMQKVTDHIVFDMETGTAMASSCPDGETLLYPVYLEDRADYAHEQIGLMLEAYLEAYRDLPMDGTALDEFGAGSRKAECYLCSAAFMERFQRQYGYDFADTLYLLNHQDTGKRFANVRHDNYKLTNDITYEYQVLAKKRFTEVFGPDIFIGFHNTWWGEGNSGDLWAGNIDYFQLTQALSGGFVDAQYDAERTMTSMNQLAESLARYSDTGTAYNMCWDRFCTPDKMEYFHRMLAVRNVNWVGHAYSPTYSKTDDMTWFIYDFGSQQETWGNIPACIRREHMFSDFIGKGKAHAKIAVTYNWESCAYYNNDYMHYHRLSLKALLDKLMLNNIPVDVLPSEETDFGEYDYIFVLWPTMMVRAQWEAVKTAIAAGKQVVFIGPPAEVTTDGEDIRAEFEQLIGDKIVKTAEFMGGHEYVAWDLWFTEKRVHMPIYLNAKNQMDYQNGNVRYYGYELPLTDLFFNILVELAPYQIIHSNQVISKAYACDGESTLAIMSRWRGRINEKFIFADHEIEIRNGVIVGIKFTEGETVKVISEPGAQILIDGKERAYAVM